MTKVKTTITAAPLARNGGASLKDVEIRADLIAHYRAGTWRAHTGS